MADTAEVRHQAVQATVRARREADTAEAAQAEAEDTAAAEDQQEEEGKYTNFTLHEKNINNNHIRAHGCMRIRPDSI